MSESLLMAVHARDPEESRVALVSGNEILDLRWDGGGDTSLVGNIYKGVVTRIEPGLDAAFVDFGGRRAGFLHIDHVHPGYEDKKLQAIEVASLPEVANEAQEKSLVIGELLEVGQEVIAQVLRNPVRGKGATLSTSLSLAGRLLVLMPSLSRSGVSRRIEDEEERGRLRELLESSSENHESVIARTAASGCTETEFRQDYSQLQSRWAEIQKRAGEGDVPCLLGGETSPLLRGVRDLLNTDVSRVVVDSENASDLIREYLENIPKEQRPKLETYTGCRPLFEKLDLERGYQLLFRSRVPMEGGGSLVIHETEALTAIDINSGRLDGGSLEETALTTNLAAAQEIARQIRLRDLGGIVVVDFIDMRQSKNRRKLEAEFRAELSRDRARLKVARLASFGLMTLTRRRLGTGLPRASEKGCGFCGGSGTLAPHHAGAFRVLRRLRAMEPQKSRLRVHPGVATLLEKEHLEGLKSHGWALSFEPDPQLAPGEMAFV